MSFIGETFLPIELQWICVLFIHFCLESWSSKKSSDEWAMSWENVKRTECGDLLSPRSSQLTSLQSFVSFFYLFPTSSLPVARIISNQEIFVFSVCK